MRFFLAIAFAMSAAPAMAGKTGNDLYDGCSRSARPVTMDDAAGLIACNNYIAGVIDGTRMTSEGQSLITIPENVTGQQLNDIVVQFLKAHPERRHQPAPYLILDAVREAFPK